MGALTAIGCDEASGALARSEIGQRDADQNEANEKKNDGGVLKDVEGLGLGVLRGVNDLRGSLHGHLLLGPATLAQPPLRER
jgi:hypothetical protein